MPIYEFECVPKGHIFDRLQKLSDPDPELCEVCGEGPIRRRVTAPSFRLAGSGWYETDFKGDKDKRRNLAGDNAPESKSNGGSDGKSDSGKSESTAQAKPESKGESAASTTASPSKSGGDA
jgi:putative FmdB family regulatory protein